MKAKPDQKKTQEAPAAVTLRVVFERPPAGVDIGLQEGHGNDYQTVQKQHTTGQDLQFEFSVAVKTDKSGGPDFGGPFVQGARGDRYVYLDIGTYAGQTATEWSRKLKIPVSIITWDQINSGKVLVVHIPGTAKDGGPSCAYEWRKRVGPDWGWKIAKK